MNKQYLGDSVYCEHDGYAAVLTTDNGYGPSNTIVLEPEVLRALLEYARINFGIGDESEAGTR